MIPAWCQVKSVLMTPPDFYRVETSINPFMAPDDPACRVDPKQAVAQWQNLVRTIEGLGVAVRLMEARSEVPDLVFPADLGLVVHASIAPKTVVLSRFKWPSRQMEVPYYEDYFQRQGYRTIHVPENVHFEINVRETDQVYYLGVGIRNDAGGVEFLRPYLEKPVRVLRLVSPWFYHLSCAMAILDDETVMYYPQAFDEESAAVLRREFRRSIILNQQEALDLAANCTNLNGTVLLGETSDRVREQLDAHGIRWATVPVGEYHKSGGAVNCLIFILDR